MGNRIPALRATLTVHIARRGAIVPLAAVLMVVLLAFVALAIDVGYICLARGQMQNAADAAALAAAAKLKDTGDRPSKARKAAKDYAALNFVAGDSVELQNDDIILGQWDDTSATFTPLAGAAQSNANAVQVTCVRSDARKNSLRLCFGGMMGKKMTDVSATATARVRTSRCGLIIGLNSVTMSGSSHTDSFSSDQGSYVAVAAGSNGHVCSNGDIKMSGSATVHGDAHPGPNKTVKSSGSSGVTGNIKSLVEPMHFDLADPGNAATNNDNSSIPNSDAGKAPVNAKGEFSLSGNDGVTLAPGTYYFNKMSLSGGSVIRINGPTTIYVLNDCSLSGGTMANYTSIPANLQLFPLGSKCVISGSSEFYGVVYAPQAKVERSGSSDYFGSIVAGTLVLSGSGGIHADDSLDLSILSQGRARSTLVE